MKITIYVFDRLWHLYSKRGHCVGKGTHDNCSSITIIITISIINLYYYEKLPHESNRLNRTAYPMWGHIPWWIAWWCISQLMLQEKKWSALLLIHFLCSFHQKRNFRFVNYFLVIFFPVPGSNRYQGVDDNFKYIIIDAHTMPIDSDVHILFYDIQRWHAIHVLPDLFCHFPSFHMQWLFFFSVHETNSVSKTPLSWSFWPDDFTLGIFVRKSENSALIVPDTLLTLYTKQPLWQLNDKKKRKSQ